MTDARDPREPDPLLLTALTTEHFVLQGTRSTITGEAGARASLYIGALSSALVALGFAGQFDDAFAPFAAAVLPAILVLGVFTYVRLAEISVEDLHYLHLIQRIRGYYRELSPQAAAFFPITEVRSDQALFAAMAIRPRQRFQFLFTAAAMVGAINSIVAGVAAALLLDGAGLARGAAIALGIVVALVAMTLHGVNQVRRYARLHATEAERELPGAPPPA